MNLSNTLFNNLTNRLKLEALLLQEEKLYVENLLNQVAYLKKLKTNDYKNLGLQKFATYTNKEKNLQDFIVVYIVNISFLKANTALHVSDIQGNLKLFFSSGSVDLAGKQKKKRRIAVSKLISLLFKKASFLGKNPVALHLNNVNFYKNLIIRKLKRSLYIKVIKIFNQTPYNGCRKKKLRRKKYTKKFK
ncbi:30S ribosomal protein S11 (mitochondrion) [Nitzschia inconspicua]|uniref:30S ribosomal protein S11 n=1 Tax=Nitzschia inconspicua TaxID=303405 RepID=A0A8H2SIJ0_9STRA|nr:30S ribosomal protein S11 [Nitzschia inconspicua]